jgi:hypothetical protein
VEKTCEVKPGSNSFIVIKHQNMRVLCHRIFEYFPINSGLCEVAENVPLSLSLNGRLYCQPEGKILGTAFGRAGPSKRDGPSLEGDIWDISRNT